MTLVSVLCLASLSLTTSETYFANATTVTPHPQSSNLRISTVKMIEVQQQHDHAFCNERFVGPLKLELETVRLDKPKRPKRRVRFDRVKKTINPEAGYYTDEDVRIKWWGFDELDDIKQRAKETSIVLRKSLAGRESSLTMAHRKTSLILASDFKALIRLSPSTPDKDLQVWCAFEDGRRGLERFASKDYSCLRRQDIINTREGVIGEQQRQKDAMQYDPEVIARVARESSRRARTFALFFGEADAGEKVAIRKPNFERRAPPRKRSKLAHSFYL
jgi:hypothetical protein